MTTTKTYETCEQIVTEGVFSNEPHLCGRLAVAKAERDGETISLCGVHFTEGFKSA